VMILLVVTDVPQNYLKIGLKISLGATLEM